MPSPGHFAVWRGRASAPIVIFSRGLAVLSFPEARFMLWWYSCGLWSLLAARASRHQGVCKILVELSDFYSISRLVSLAKAFAVMDGPDRGKPVHDDREPTPTNS